MTYVEAWLMGMAGGFGLGVCTGGIVCTRAWKLICIQRGFAQYNATSGKWEWKQ